MNHTDELVTRIDERLAQARHDIDTLQAARDAMRDAAKPRAVAPRRRAAGPRAKRQQPLGAETLEALLVDGDGLSTTRLSEQANADRDRVLVLLRDLEATGRVRRSGQRRGTRWHAVTDDDRVAARAAELGRRRKRAA